MIQDYGFRLYNPAIGKFLSVDPLAPDYPWYTPYQFAGNKPIQAIDLDGLEEFFPYMENWLHEDDDHLGTTTAKVVGNGVVGVINMFPYLGNMANSVWNEGPSGPINMVDNDLNQMSNAIAEDMIDAKQNEGIENGLDYIIDRVQKPEVIQQGLTFIFAKKIFSTKKTNSNKNAAPGIGVLLPENQANTVTYYRVQGGTPPKASRHIIDVGESGNVSFKNTTLNISTGNLEHAKYFQTLRPGSKIYSFEVPQWLDDVIQEYAIPQKNYKTNPNNQGGLAPKIVDPTTPGRSYELPATWSKWLNENHVKGSGKVLK